MAPANNPNTSASTGSAISALTTTSLDGLRPLLFPFSVSLVDRVLGLCAHCKCVVPKYDEMYPIRWPMHPTILSDGWLLGGSSDDGRVGVAVGPQGFGYSASKVLVPHPVGCSKWYGRPILVFL
jgi:hypothetical protein